MENNKSTSTMKKIGQVLKVTGRWAYRLRSVLLSIPVIICAVSLALRNIRLLPETVGINLLSSGEYQWMIDKGVAVMAPLGVTAICLLLVFCSKKVLYPWLISVFSLVLPVMIWLTNVFPA